MRPLNNPASAINRIHLEKGVFKYDHGLKSYSITGMFALIDGQTNEVIGVSEAAQFSPMTLAKFQEFADSAEADLVQKLQREVQKGGVALGTAETDKGLPPSLGRS